jgi:hypothetical protein
MTYQSAFRKFSILEANLGLINGTVNLGELFLELETRGFFNIQPVVGYRLLPSSIRTCISAAGLELKAWTETGSHCHLPHQDKSTALLAGGADDPQDQALGHSDLLRLTSRQHVWPEVPTTLKSKLWGTATYSD